MTNEIQTYHLILAAFLGSLGTLITNFIWDRIKENTKKGILLVGLASEIKVIREDLSGQLFMMRKDLKNDSQTRPDGLEFSSVIFTANAGSLGLFGDGDFVDHLVETYSSLNSLITHSHSFQRFTNDQISREQVCEYHVFATSVHLQVIKLHKRLLSELKRSPPSENEAEKTTRKLADRYQKHFKENPNTTNWTHQPTSYSTIPEQD